MEDHLRRSQFCTFTGKSILDAVATVRDAITYAETTGTPLCTHPGLRESLRPNITPICV
jgi:hypothetical protein